MLSQDSVFARAYMRMNERQLMMMMTMMMMMDKYVLSPVNHRTSVQRPRARTRRITHIVKRPDAPPPRAPSPRGDMYRISLSCTLNGSFTPASDYLIMSEVLFERDLFFVSDFFMREPLFLQASKFEWKLLIISCSSFPLTTTWKIQRILKISKVLLKSISKCV